MVDQLLKNHDEELLDSFGSKARATQSWREPGEKLSFLKGKT